MNKQLSNCRGSHWMFLVGFLFFTLIMWCAPYSSDDLEFAALEYSTVGEYMTYVLQYGNGRVLGNICAIALSNSKVLCVLIKAFLLSSSMILICDILEIFGTGDRLIAFVMFVMIDPSVFGEVYVWTSGFSNYFPPIWLTLIIIFLLKHYQSLKNCFLRSAVCVLIFLMGLASQLFIEHSSGVNLLLALTFTCISFRKKNDTVIPCSIWLLAAAAGLTVMLTVPKLFYIPGNHTETYRSVNMGSLTLLILTCAKNTVQLCGHYFGVCLLPVCFGAVATVFLTQDQRSEKENRILFGLSLVSVLYLLVSVFLTAANYLGKGALIQHAVDCIFTVLPFLVWILAALRLPRGRTQASLVLCLAFAAVSLAPLLVVTPIPTRVIYQSYIFVMMAAILCTRPLLCRFTPKVREYMLLAAKTVCLLLILVIGSVFMCIRFMADARDQHIRQELKMGSPEIIIFQLPYEYATWDHLWSQKYAYGTGDEVTFSAISFEQWMNNIH